MAIKTFAVGEVLTASDTNTYLANSGLVYVTSTTIGSAVSSITVSNCFTSTYDAYKIVITGGTATVSNTFRFNLDGSTASYFGGLIYHPYATATANAQGIGRNNIAYLDFAGFGSTSSLVMDLDVYGPFLAKTTSFRGASVVNNSGASVTAMTGFHDSAASYSGFRLVLDAGTVTGGTITVYGYRKA
jgi:hypothetical protein